MAEVSSKTVQPTDPPPSGGTSGTWKPMIYVAGTSASNNDTITVTGLATVVGAYLVSTTGVVGTCTYATNVITITNGGTLVWSGIAWGT